jgi:hypothetical protein
LGQFLIEEQKTWHRIRYALFANRASYEINWTKHLPSLRRLRKHELTINELLDMADKVPEKDAQTFINVYEERPQGLLADKFFMEGIWVLKVLYEERDRLAELPEGEMFEKAIRRFGASNQKHLMGFLRGSKFWHSRAHFQRPEAEEYLLNLNVFANVETIEGKRFLQCGITDGKSVEFLATVPVKQLYLMEFSTRSSVLFSTRPRPTNQRPSKSREALANPGRSDSPNLGGRGPRPWKTEKFLLPSLKCNMTTGLSSSLLNPRPTSLKFGGSQPGVLIAQLTPKSGGRSTILAPGGFGGSNSVGEKVGVRSTRINE